MSFVITGLSCVAEERAGVKEEGKQQLFLPSGARRMFPQREKVMGSSVKIKACPADNADSRVNQGVVADV